MAKNTIYLSFIAMLLVITVSGCVQEPVQTGVGVTRSLSSSTVSPGSSVTVTLTVNVGGADYYAIDDIYPSGWTVTDSGEGSTEHSGHWKTVLIENAEDTTYTYSIKAPSQAGTYTFSGTYMFEGMTSEVSIGGQGTITVV